MLLPTEVDSRSGGQALGRSQAWTWSRVIQAPPGEQAARLWIHALAVDDRGAVWVAGTALGPIEIVSGTRVPADGAEHAFLMKLDDQGRVMWVRRLGSRRYSGEGGPPRGVTAMVSDGNTIVVAGAFDLRLRGRYTSGTLARLNGDGTVRWIRKDNVLARIGEDEASRAMAVVVAADGGIAVAGCTRVWEISTVRGGQASESRRHGFVASFSPEGEQRWTYALHAGTGKTGPGVLHLGQLEEPAACGTAVAVGPAQDVFAAGTFHRLPAAAKDVGIPEEGSFLARLSPEGKLRWSQVISRYPSTVRLASLPGGKVVVAGALDATPNPTAGLAAYDPAGNRLWQVQARAVAALDYEGTFVASRDGALVWAGRLFGKTTIGGFALDGPEASGECAFVARYRQDGELVSVTPVRGGATCAPTAQAVGRTLWIAGNWFGARDGGTYVHRMFLPERARRTR
jgi:hypothetical protein